LKQKAPPRREREGGHQHPGSAPPPCTPPPPPSPPPPHPTDEAAPRAGPIPFACESLEGTTRSRRAAHRYYCHPWSADNRSLPPAPPESPGRRPSSLLLATNPLRSWSPPRLAPQPRPRSDPRSTPSCGYTRRGAFTERNCEKRRCEWQVTPSLFLAPPLSCRPPPLIARDSPRSTASLCPGHKAPSVPERQDPSAPGAVCPPSLRLSPPLRPRVRHGPPPRLGPQAARSPRRVFYSRFCFCSFPPVCASRRTGTPCRISRFRSRVPFFSLSFVPVASRYPPLSRSQCLSPRVRGRRWRLITGEEGRPPGPRTPSDAALPLPVRPPFPFFTPPFAPSPPASSNNTVSVSPVSSPLEQAASKSPGWPRPALAAGVQSRPRTGPRYLSRGDEKNGPRGRLRTHEPRVCRTRVRRPT